MSESSLAARLRPRWRRALQKLFWHRAGFALLRQWVALNRRVEYVLLNYSLDSDTNGETWLVDQTRDGGLVVDVGFYEGDFARKVLSRKPRSRVVAFDPSRRAAGVVSRSWSGTPQFEFRPKALSRAAGRLLLHDGGDMCASLGRRVDTGLAAGSGAGYEVEVSTLDAELGGAESGAIELLKVDAEGFDLDVLEGAAALLQAGRIRLILFEYAGGWIGNRRFLFEAVEFLGRHGYGLFRLFNGFVVPLHYSAFDEYPFRGCMFVSQPRSGGPLAPAVIRR